MLSISGGVGVITGIDPGKLLNYKTYQKVDITSLSVPLELDASIEITNDFGIGISCYGNINPNRSFAGGMLKLYIGKLL